MAYLDGELSPLERGRMAEHIVGCETCRDTVNDLRAVSGALTKWVVSEPSGLPSARKLLERAGAAPAPVPRIAPWRDAALRWGVAAALLVVAATIGAVVMTRSGRGPTLVAHNEQATPASAPPAVEPAPQLPETLGDAAHEGTNAPGAVPPATPSSRNAPARQEDAKEQAAPKDSVQAAPDAAGGGADQKQTTDLPLDQQAAPPAPPVQAPATTGSAAPDGEAVTATAPDPEERSEEEQAKTAGAAPKPAALAKRLAEGLEIRSAMLTLETGALEPVLDNIEAAAHASNGSITSRGAVVRKENGRTTTIVVVVPADRFESTIARIKGLGSVKAEVRTSRDVDAALNQLDTDREADETRTAKRAEPAARRKRELIDRASQATIKITLVEPR